ncbi:MAG: SusC/RagA family TonB-linked outer membrane protein, partial [Marinifilum sp.]|nr:SusC/RagA family TonB-linked outer membrane protein [Marinifilum sp.]
MKIIGNWRALPPSIRKIVRVMKVSVFLVLVCTLQLSASVMLGQQVKLQSGEMSVREVFKELKTQTGTYFMFSEKEVNADLIVNADFSEVSLEEALDEICKQASLQYEIVDDYVLITKKAPVVEQPVQQEKKEVKGKVTDDEGMPLPGVSVVVKGTNIGVATDIDGNYSIEFDNTNAVLVFSFVGMLSQEIAYNGQSVQNVTLLTDSEQMDEVVVVGYGSQKKERIGSAITQVSAEEIEERAAGAVSIEQVIGGQIKGVQIAQSSGAPGAESTIRVRGITSPFVGGNNQPLYVIDGVIFNTDAQFNVGLDFTTTENPLLSINPADIESFSVLKDAGATAIYGSRGANGVIIINTKRGKKSSKTRISLDYNYSIANPIKTQDVLDAEGFKQLHKMIANNTMDAYAEGFASSTGNSSAGLILNSTTREFHEGIYDLFTGETVPLFGDADTDWQNELYRNNAGAHQLNFNMTGGNDKTNYSFSLNHTDQEGMIINDELKRYGARLGLDSELKKWLKVGSTLSYSHTNNFSGAASGGLGAPTDAMTSRPDYSIYNDKDEFQRIPSTWVALGPAMGYTYGMSANPVASRESSNTSKSYMFNGNAYLEIKPLKDLKLRADINIG